MNRLSSAGTVAATALWLVAFMAAGSAQESLPAGPSADGAAPPPAPRAIAARPSPGGSRQRFRPAYVVTGSELRSGPGAQYQLVQILPEGITVGVTRCSGAWCEVVWRNRRGFASASVLSIDEAGPAYDLPPDDGAPPAYDGGPGYMGANFTWGVAVGIGYGPHSHYHRSW